MLLVATSFAETPLGTTLIGAACMGLIVLIGATLKIVMQLTRMGQQITSLHDDIMQIKSDPDIMRWSNYGRMMQSLPGNPGNGGVK